MSCEISDRDRRIDDFLMNKLTPVDAEAFEVHLFSCSVCLQELRLREQMIEIIKKEHVTVIPAVVKARPAKTPARLIQASADFFRLRPNAWVYVGVTAAVLMLILILPRFRGKEIADSNTANFAASPQLESLAGQTLRSSDLSVAIASPRNGENFSSEDILFRWQIKKSEENFDLPLKLKILNNQGTVIHNARVEGQEYRWREPLAAGLYYWTIEYRGEMLYLGKFFFKKPSQ